MSGDMRPIGVFDSGCGGVSTLIEIARLLPAEDLIYYGDQAFAPYGTRDEGYVLDRAETVTRLLLDLKVKALVIACNTATGKSCRTRSTSTWRPKDSARPRCWEQRSSR